MFRFDKIKNLPCGTVALNGVSASVNAGELSSSRAKWIWENHPTEKYKWSKHSRHWINVF